VTNLSNVLALPFVEIWAEDFEWIPRPGERPDVVCYGARELRSGRTLRLWRDQLGPTSPNRTDSQVLFLSFVFNAEGVSRLSLGWQLPTKIIDLSALFRCVVNGRIVPQGKGLLGALAYYGIPSVEVIYKEKIRKLIMRGGPYTPEEQAEILKYIMTDVNPLFELFSRLMAEPEFDLGTALHWGEFSAVSAQMEHRGVPLDMEVVTDLLDKKAWAYVRDAVVPKINAQYDVYVQDKAGEWHFNLEKFDALCVRLGIDWPGLGQLLNFPDRPPALRPLCPPNRRKCGHSPRSRSCIAASRHLYSITSSARASSVGGTSRPIVLAVCRLITNSNVVGRSAGRSAGFSPLRMRPA
jgi:hypothetical protein